MRTINMNGDMIFLDGEPIISTNWKDLYMYLSCEEYLPFPLSQPTWITFDQEPSSTQSKVSFKISNEKINNASIPLHLSPRDRPPHLLEKATGRICIASSAAETSAILSYLNQDDKTKQIIADIADECCYTACKKLAANLGFMSNATADLYVVGQSAINFWDAISHVRVLSSQSSSKSLTEICSKSTNDIDVYELIADDMKKMLEAIDLTNKQLMEIIGNTNEPIINMDVKQTDDLGYVFPDEGVVEYGCGKNSSLVFHFASFDSVMLNKTYAYVESLWNQKPREKDHIIVAQWVIREFGSADNLLRARYEFREYEKEVRILFQEDIDIDNY